MPRNSEPKQLEVLAFIHQQVTNQGYPPTIREICDAVGLSSTSTVHGHINRLIKRGYLQKDPAKPRALEITQEGLSAIGIWQLKMPLTTTPFHQRSKTMMICSCWRLRETVWSTWAF